MDGMGSGWIWVGLVGLFWFVWRWMKFYDSY